MCNYKEPNLRLIGGLEHGLVDVTLGRGFGGNYRPYMKENSRSCGAVNHVIELSHLLWRKRLWCTHYQPSDCRAIALRQGNRQEACPRDLRDLGGKRFADSTL